ncbi:MAG: hypothetical protein VCD00_02110 [Candidatus Hydrogenedentota bacterium]
MVRVSDIKLPFDHAEDDLRSALIERLGIPGGDLLEYTVFRRATDARKRDAIYFVYMLDATVRDENACAEHPHIQPTPDMEYPFVIPPIDAAPASTTSESRRPIVVGLGPSGMFAALLLAQMGLCPIVIERGKKARARAQDVFGFWRKNEFNPSSNVQFGEGGAGTFSDGKLTTRIKNENNRVRKVLYEMAKAGAPEEIRHLAKPHIGTYKIIRVVRALRAEIIRLGGEVRFETQVTDLHIDHGHIRGVRLSTGEQLDTDHLIVAIGHSARDTFKMLYDRGVHFDAKPFSIGVRIEHPQSLIDQSQFGKFSGDKRLGAADYKLVHHCSNGRGAYSFCMCPGGTVIASASEPGQVVTNGMSYYSRSLPNANSALAIDISPADFGDTHPLAGVEYQRIWEKKAYAAGGSNYFAPVQRIEDFLAKRPTKELGDVQPAYTPGVTPADLRDCLPDYITEAMREAIPAMDRKLRGYAMPDAILTGIETRTSSPVRIRRGPDFQSISIRGLYPAGEGAGYAGGIMSAAVDGIKVAEAVARNLNAMEVDDGSVPEKA